MARAQKGPGTNRLRPREADPADLTATYVAEAASWSPSSSHADRELELALQAILEGVRLCLRYDQAQVTVWDEAKGVCTTRAWAGKRVLLDRSGGSRRLDEGFTSWIARNRRELWIPDMSAARDVRPKVALRGAYAGVPVWSVPLEGNGAAQQGSFLGTLEVASAQPGAYGADTAAVLGPFARQVAMAVQQAAFRREVCSRIEALEACGAIAAAIAEGLPLDDVLKRLAGAARDVVGGDAAVVLVCHLERSALRVAAALGIDATDISVCGELPLALGGRAHAAATREPLIVSDVEVLADASALLPPPLRERFRAFADVPLVHAGQAIGMLSVFFRSVHLFSAEDVDILQAFGNQAAVAVENARLLARADAELRQREEALRRQNRQLATLYQAATASGSSLSLDLVLRTVADQAMRISGADGCYFLIQSGHREADAASAPGDRDAPERTDAWTAAQVVTVLDYIRASPERTDKRQLSLAVSDYPAAHRALATRRPVLVRRASPMVGQAEREWMERHAAGTLLILPLIAHDRVLGLLGLAIESAERDFTSDEIRLAQGLAAQAAVAMDNAWLYERAQQEIAERRRAQEALSRLQRVGREVNATFDLNRILQLVLDEAAHATGAEYGSVLLRDRLSGEIALYGTIGLTDRAGAILGSGLLSSERLSQAEWGAALLHGSTLLVDGLQGEGGPAAVLLGEPNAQSVLGVPILVEEQTAGLIVLGGAQPGAFDTKARAFVEALAAQAAVAVGNAERFQEQHERSELLYTRAEQLARVLEVSRALRSDRPLDAMLEEIAYAVHESVGYGRVQVSVLEGDPPALRCVAGAGIPLAVLERLKKARWPWAEVVRFLRDEHRLGQSYRVPAECLVHVTGWKERDLPGDVGVDGVSLEREYGSAGDVLMVPLVGAGGDTRGLLLVDGPQAGSAPDLTTVRALEVFAEQAALAIENARLVEELRLRVDTLALFDEVTRAVTAQLDLDAVLGKAVEVMAEALRCDSSVVFLAEPATRRYVLRAAHGVLPTQPAGPGFAPGEGLVGHVVQSGMPVTLDATDGGGELLSLLGQEVRSAVFAPLTVGQMVAGVLGVGRARHNPLAESGFTATEVATIAALGDQIAVAVENARLFDQVRRFSQELEARVEARTRELAAALQDLTLERDRVEALYRITARLAASLDLDAVVEQALVLIAGAVASEETVLVLTVDDRGERTALRAVKDGHITVVERFQAQAVPARWNELVARVTHERCAVVLPGTALHEGASVGDASAPAAGGTGAVLAVPLSVGEAVLGGLVLFSSQPGHFTADQQRLASAAAAQVATAISNARLYRLVRDQAERLSDMLKAQQVEAAKSQAILEGVADGVIVADATGRVVLVNAAAERILQLSQAEALGRTTSEMLGLYGTQAQERLRKIQEWAANPRSYTPGEYLDAQLTIAARIISVHLAPVFMGEEFVGTVSVFRDVTAEVEAERSRVEFVSMVSHELRTPITPICGYADLLLMGAAGEQTQLERDFLTAIKRNAERLTLLVSDLLDLSRIEAGRLEFMLQETDIRELVNSVLTGFEASALENGPRLRSEVDATLPPVMADPNRVVQILNNLVANACQYTLPEGEVVVSARVEGGEVQITVRDTGIGIPADIQGKVFDRFFRAEHPLVQSVPGTGLGLAIVKSLVEMHRGRVWVESEPGRGSAFTFTLPILPTDQMWLRQRGPRSRRRQPDLGGAPLPSGQPTHSAQVGQEST